MPLIHSALWNILKHFEFCGDDEMRIAVDAFGGDNAPLEILKGCSLAVKEYNVDITLTGDKNIIEDCARQNGISLERMDIVDTPVVLSMHDEPTDIVKKKADSSMALAFKELKEDRADAFVSAGSTGGVVVGGTLIVKRIKGVSRVALASLLPSPDKSFLFLDMGANAVCRPEMLAQFGVMGSVYMQKVEGRDNPTVGLLNIGVEESKGGDLQQEAYKLLQQAPINFVGNIESREMPKGVCDVLVTDGFTGNIALKLYEGVLSTTFKLIKQAMYKNIINKIAALILKKDLYEIKAKGDAKEVGGALLLGASKPVVKAHGSSDAIAFKNAIRQAISCCENNIIETISEGLSALK